MGATRGLNKTSPLVAQSLNHIIHTRAQPHHSLKALYSSVSLQLQLLGQPAIIEGTRLEPPKGKTSALLYYLAYQGDWVSREDILYLIWPDIEEKKARSNLRQMLSANRQLPYLANLETEPTRLRWSVQTDVHGFNKAVTEKQWAKVVRLYQGSFLEGIVTHTIPEFESWLELERSSLFRTYRTAVFKCAAELEADARYPQAVELLKNLHKTDSLDEVVFRRYLELLALSEQASEAVSAYETFARNLQAEFEGEPEPATQQLVAHIRSGESLAASSTKVTIQSVAKPSPKGQLNIPMSATTFVGRQREISEVIQELSDPSCRLLTLVAAGGMGKTRLVLEVGERLAPDFADGVYFIPFDAVSTPELMVSALADGLDFSFFGQQEPKDQLLDFLKRKDMLLIMDNLEHLLEGVTLLATILEQAPKLNILATSREVLNLKAERVFELSGLGLHQQEDQRLSDAHRLFIQSAKQRRRDLELNEKNLIAIRGICERLEGMPLAIELAASWLNILTPQDIAKELNQGIDILEGQSRDAPKRHQSMRAVFEHSWTLLNSREQQVLRKLAVFRGGFRREAASEVAGATLPILASLVNKSLLRVLENGRYDRHSLLFQYTQEKLAEQPLEQNLVQAKHCAYYFHFLDLSEKDRRGLGEKEMMTAIGEELGNILVAWDWIIVQPNETRLKALKHAEILTTFFERQGLFKDGIKIFSKAATTLCEANPSHQVVLGILMHRQAQLYLGMGQYQKARSLAQCSVDLVRSLGEKAILIRGLNVLGGIARRLGDYPKTKIYYEEAYTLALALTGNIGAAPYLQNMALAERALGNYLKAKEYNHQALKLHRKGGDRFSEAMTLTHLGVLSHNLGDLQNAETFWQEGLKLAKEISFSGHIPYILYNLGQLAFIRGEFDTAQQLGNETLQMAQALRDISITIMALNFMSQLATFKTAYSDAQGYFRQSLEMAWRNQALPFVLECLLYIAEWFNKQGQVTQAYDCLTFVVNNTALEAYFQDYGQRLLKELKDSFSVEEWQKTFKERRALKLEEVVEELIRTA